MTQRKAGRSRRHIRAAVLVPATAAVLMSAAGVGYTAPGQPGVTGPSDGTGRAEDQPGVASVPPPRPQEQSPLGVVIPDPPQRDPGEYRDPPSPPVSPPQPEPQDEPAPWVEPDQPDVQVWYDEPESPIQPQQSVPQQSVPEESEPEESPSTLGEELGGLHAPEPTTPPKLLRPPPPNRLGLGELTVDSPLPADATWEINQHLAEAQAVTDGAFQSVGFSEDRSTRMAVGGVAGAALGGAIGFGVACVPAAVTTGAAGALLGAGVGAAVGNVPGAAAGAGLGAVGGAAAGCVGAGIAGAAIGGAIGGAAGVIATAGDGSDLPERPEPAPAEPAPVEPSPVEPAPAVQDQAQQWVDDSVATADAAVQWAEAQPGGPQAIEAAATAGEAASTWYQEQPWSPQVDQAVTGAAETVVAGVESDPAAAAVVDVVAAQPPLAPGQLGGFTDAANGALAAVQGVL